MWRRPLHRVALALLLAVGLQPFASPQSQTATPGRFLYVISCDARVDKLDTVANRKLNTYDLANQTGKESLIPRVQGPLDGCLASQVVFDSKSSTFSTAVAVTNEPRADGTKGYRVLTFSVPEMRLVKQQDGGENLDAPPHLELQLGALKILKPGNWTPQTELDLSDFSPDMTRTPNQVLESSGDQVLLRLFTGDDTQLVIAVADRKIHKLVRLQGVPTTVTPNVHLAPGGAYVLIEETGAGEKPEKTGKLFLFDAMTGRLQTELNDGRINKLYFLAISPDRASRVSCIRQLFISHAEREFS
jgi:hypothetical protein